MLNPDKTTFLLIWPRCFIVFLGLIELLAFVMFILTELCSVAANFWITNVFAGGWCGIVVLIHAIALFVAGLCSPGPSSAFRAALLTILLFIACGALISFDIAFLIQPTTCILTSSCSANAYSSTAFNYGFRSSFYQVFNSWEPFKTYSESQVKVLCQAIQLGLAGLCLILGIAYLVIYFECLRRLKKHQQIGPNLSPKPNDYNTLQDNYMSPLPNGQRILSSSSPPPPPVTPGQVYPNAYPQLPNQQVYMMHPPAQQVFVAPPPPQPQLVYYPPPPPQVPSSGIQSMYYGPPPPAPPPQAAAWRPPVPFSAQAQSTVRPCLINYELPLKLIELSDFLRSPSILSKRLYYKQPKLDETLQANQPNKIKQELKSKEPVSGIILLTQKAISNETHQTITEEKKQNELFVPKDIIVFADDIDRKKLGIFQKSNNYFSRHLLITSGAALQALISPLTNAKEWIIVCKLKYSKRYTKQPSIHGTVIISLNITHPLVRYELLTALDLLQQSFNEIKSAYIVVDFSQILIRWFKTYLQRTDQYPSLSNRLLYRYRFQAWKCSITLGKRQLNQDNDYQHFSLNLQKMLHKSDIPMQIYIDFNSLPTNVYSIELNNIFIYSMNNDYKQMIKDMGNGLSLISIQDFNNCLKEQGTKSMKTSSLTEKEENQQKDDTNSILATYEPNEQERALLEKLWDNRIRIQMQHQQLMMKATRLISFPSINNDLINRKINQQTINSIPY
ncbi:hypothetical protein I4U23_031182 [Adineta vaga]|nr:hypothetical protein I4U23_031182 [Adineta vaga]